MGQYLVSFVAYTFAMIGVILVSMIVYKKCFSKNSSSKSVEFLSIENCLNISARKSLYVVKAGNERFLIASDVDKTTFLAKLDDKQELENIYAKEFKTENRLKKTALAGISIGEDLKVSSTSNIRKMPVMKELAKKISAQRG